MLGTLEVTERAGVPHARLGAAESDIDVYDAMKNQLRVELFGCGSVLEAIVLAGASRPEEMRIVGQTFVRR